MSIGIVIVIVLLAVLASAACVAVFFEAQDARKSDKRIRDIEALAQETERELYEAHVRAAYKNGIEAGRGTDELYKQFLKQFSVGQQVCAMIYGIEAAEEMRRSGGRARASRYGQDTARG